MKDFSRALRFQDAINRRTFLSRTGGRHRRGRPGDTPRRHRACGFRRQSLHPQRRQLSLAPDSPIFRPKPSALFSCSRPARRRRWTSLTTSRNLKKCAARTCRIDVRKGQRLTGMTSGQSSFPVAPTIFKFNAHGKNGTLLSELLPHTAKVIDELCIIKSTYTEAINHDPAVTFIQTGSQIAGRPSIGSWFSYGLGSENKDLPAYVVMISRGKGQAQPLADRDWGSGFLPTKYAGVRFEGSGEPVRYLRDPEGRDRAMTAGKCSMK